jgi:hypothetical protein
MNQSSQHKVLIDKMIKELKMEEENHVQRSKAVDLRIFCRNRLNHFPKSAKLVLTQCQNI